MQSARGFFDLRPEYKYVNNLTLSDVLNPTANIIDFSSKEDSFTALYASSDEIYIFNLSESSDSTMSLDITDQYLGFQKTRTSPSQSVRLSKNLT